MLPGAGARSRRLCQVRPSSCEQARVRGLRSCQSATGVLLLSLIHILRSISGRVRTEGVSIRDGEEGVPSVRVTGVTEDLKLISIKE